MPTRTLAMVAVVTLLGGRLLSEAASADGSTLVLADGENGRVLENAVNFPWWAPSIVCLGLMFWLLRVGIGSSRRYVARDYAGYLRRHHPEYEILGEVAGGLRIRHGTDGHERVVLLHQLYPLLGNVRGIGPDADRRRDEVYASFTDWIVTGGETRTDVTRSAHGASYSAGSRSGRASARPQASW